MCLTCQMSLLEDHENTVADRSDFEMMICPDCEVFKCQVESGQCYHCFNKQAELESCPVCECAEIPAVFFDADMREELDRLKRARDLQVQH